MISYYCGLPILVSNAHFYINNGTTITLFAFHNVLIRLDAAVVVVFLQAIFQ